MDRHEIALKIAEIRSYIASDWPDIEERKALYAAIKEMESALKAEEEGNDQNPHT